MSFLSPARLRTHVWGIVRVQGGRRVSERYRHLVVVNGRVVMLPEGGGLDGLGREPIDDLQGLEGMDGRGGR